MDSLEIISLCSNEFDRIAGLMPDCCVIQIERVNQSNEEYEDRISKVKDPIIKEMFHGTKSKNVPDILDQGLKASKNVISAYGKGTYFSPDVKLSLNSYTDKNKYNDMSYVFLCDVILNDTGGNKKNIYVCPQDHSFKLKYLISFYKV